MADKTDNSKHLLGLYKALFFDLTMAAGKTGLGIAKEGELEQAAWRAYDGWVRVINDSASTLFADPLFGDYVAGSLHQMMRWQRLTSAMSGAAFTALRSAAELPAASEARELRQEVHNLRHELRALIEALPRIDASPMEERGPLKGGDTWMRRLNGRIEEKAAA